MSSNGETSVVLRGVTHGAVDFLIKPVRIEELRNVWQHVVRRKRDQVLFTMIRHSMQGLLRHDCNAPTLAAKPAIECKNVHNHACDRSNEQLKLDLATDSLCCLLITGADSA